MLRCIFSAFLLLAISLAWAQPASSAGARPPRTEMEIIGRCITADQVGESGGCGYYWEICNSIRQVLRTEHTDADACSRACGDAVRSIRQYNIRFGCPRTLRNGVNMCRRHCRATYTE